MTDDDFGLLTVSSKSRFASVLIALGTFRCKM